MVLKSRIEEMKQLFREQREELDSLRLFVANKSTEPKERQVPSPPKLNTSYVENRSALSFLSEMLPSLIQVSPEQMFSISRAAKRILRSWLEYRSYSDSLDIWVPNRAMTQSSGYYLFAFRIPYAFTGRFEIGFTRNRDINSFTYRQSVQFISSTGLVFRGGDSERVTQGRQFLAACQGGDTLTLAVTSGVGIITVLNDRLGEGVSGPIGIELPIFGDVYPVIRASGEFIGEIELVEPANAPLITEIACNHEWITSGPLLPGFSATLEISDLSVACSLGLTTAVGAAACAAQISVRPLWQVDLFSCVISEFSELNSSSRRFQHSAHLGDPVVITNHGHHNVTVEVSGNILRFEIPDDIFIISDGLTLAQVDYE